MTKFKIWCRFEKDKKDVRKNFSFCDICIWIVCCKLSLASREYILSAVNVLTKSLKTLDVTQSDSFSLNYLQSDQWIWQRCWQWYWISVLGRFSCYLWRGPLKQDLLDICLTTYFGALIFGNTWIMRVIFFRKYSKFNVDSENPQKNWEKSDCFWDKCIWICCVKFPLLRREYLSSAVNVLTNILNISHVTKRDSFQLNYLHNDQWIL